MGIFVISKKVLIFNDNIMIDFQISGKYGLLNSGKEFIMYCV